MISVVVRTHNRAGLLKLALETLTQQLLSPDEYEVIVVDNNSSDHTRVVVEAFASSGKNVRHCFEPSLGGSHAGNAGCKIARGEYVGFMDDDAKAPPEWLEIAARIIRDDHPDLFGGPYYPYYVSPKPDWFKDSYESGELGPTARNLKPGEFLNLTNMFIRRDLMELLGGFCSELGMFGTTIGYGEETQLQIAARAMKPDLTMHFEPQLQVFHAVRPEKMVLPWIARRRFVMGRYNYRVLRERTGYHSLPVPLSLLKFCVIFAYFLLDVGLCTWLRGTTKWPGPQNYLYEHAFPILERVGSAYQELSTSLRKW